MLISLTEAVNNAIIHGNNSDSNKYVRLKVIREKSVLSFTITDEGKGFDPEGLKNPVHPDHIDCCGGRGVHIMKHLSHRLDFHNNGRTVEIQFLI